MRQSTRQLTAATVLLTMVSVVPARFLTTGALAQVDSSGAPAGLSPITPLGLEAGSPVGPPPEFQWAPWN
jgi:hypothetical protein